MPTFRFTAPDGQNYEVAGPEGATEQEAFQMLQGQMAAPAEKPQSGVQRLGALLNDIPRQVGLTARYALEGPAQAAQVVTEPLRYATDRLTGMTGRTKPLGAVASDFADTIGLPKPANALERVVGEGTKMMAGAGAGGGATQAASRVLNAGRSIASPVIGSLETMAANPGAQVLGAAGAGTAGQLSKEAGGGPWQQAGAALIGGLAGNFGATGLGAGVDATRRGIANLRPQAQAPQTVDIRISNLLDTQGIKFADLAPQVQNSLRQDAAKALSMGDRLDETALGRLASFRQAGMTPTRGMISQNPIDITREQNLAKTAANMGVSNEAQLLPLLQNRNNSAAIGRLNDLGAGTGVLPGDAGRVVAGAVGARNAANVAAEKGAWNAAREAPGHTRPISTEPLGAVNKALGDEALMPFMNPGVSKYIEALQMNPGQFTPQAYANLRSMLSAELAKGGNEARAAGAAVRALDSSQLRPVTNARGLDLGQSPVTQETATLLKSYDAQSGDAIKAIDEARRATAKKYGYQDSNALVRSVLSDARSADPKRIADSFIIGGTPAEARMVAAEVGDAGRETIRQSLANYIKQETLGKGVHDETGKASAKALGTVLDRIGDEKLGVFFTPQQIGELRNLHRAVALSTAQPAGSAVNNSNTAAMLVGKLTDVLSAVPGIGPLAVAPVKGGIQNIQIAMGNRQAQNIPRGLLANAPAAPGGNAAAPLVIPGLAFGGLLAAPSAP